MYLVAFILEMYVCFMVKVMICTDIFSYFKYTDFSIDNAKVSFTGQMPKLAGKYLMTCHCHV